MISVSKSEVFFTPKRLTSPYLFRAMLGFFSRPTRSKDFFFAQIWNQKIGDNHVKKEANNKFLKSLKVLQVHLQINSTR